MRDTRQRIVDAALSLIAERGYTATTTRAIAERAGVNEVTLFRRFGSKAGVLEAIGEELVDGAHPRSVDVAAASPRSALREAARSELARVARFGAATLRLTVEAGQNADVARALGSGSGPAASLDALATTFAAWQERGLMRGDVEAHLLAEGFSALTGGVLLTRSATGIPAPSPEAAAAQVDALVDLFCDGAGVPR